MKLTILAFLMVLLACGRFEVTTPSNPSDSTATATSTATGTSASSAPAATPQVVVNNTIENNQNNDAAPAATSMSPSGQIAKGDSEEKVQAILGEPAMVSECGSNSTGWWYAANTYCIGFANGEADYQYNVPADKLYLPSW